MCWARAARALVRAIGRGPHHQRITSAPPARRTFRTTTTTTAAATAARAHPPEELLLHQRGVARRLQHHAAVGVAAGERGAGGACAGDGEQEGLQQRGHVGGALLGVGGRWVGGGCSVCVWGGGGGEGAAAQRNSLVHVHRWLLGGEHRAWQWRVGAAAWAVARPAALQRRQRQAAPQESGGPQPPGLHQPGCTAAQHTEQRRSWGQEPACCRLAG
jgi:hypothetical protein